VRRVFSISNFRRDKIARKGTSRKWDSLITHQSHREDRSAMTQSKEQHGTLTMDDQRRIHNFDLLELVSVSSRPWYRSCYLVRYAFRAEQHPRRSFLPEWGATTISFHRDSFLLLLLRRIASHALFTVSSCNGASVVKRLMVMCHYPS
jgi:hypothetical protein